MRFRLLLVSLFAAVLSACPSDPTDPVPLVPSPAALDFGDAAPGERVELQLVLTNDGVEEAQVDPSDVAVEGPFGATLAASQTVTTGENFAVTVWFDAPAEAGDFDGTLTISAMHGAVVTGGSTG